MKKDTPDIYYVGGTVAKDISSEDVIRPLADAGKRAFYKIKAVFRAGLSEDC